jgi:formylglycine-generating enzyme required for sulfatase activity
MKNKSQNKNIKTFVSQGGGHNKKTANRSSNIDKFFLLKKRSNQKNILAIAVVAFFAVFLFSGCQKKEEPKTSLIPETETNKSEDWQEKKDNENSQLIASQPREENFNETGGAEETTGNYSEKQENEKVAGVSFFQKTIDQLKEKIWNDLPKKLKAITTDDIRIRSGSIRRPHIQDDAIDSGKIENSTIKEKDLSDETITALQITPDDSVTSAMIINGTIKNEDISADAQIDSSKLDLSDYQMINLPTDEEKSKLGELIDDTDSDIAIGDKNISNIHRQNTDTGTDSATFTIGNDSADASIHFGSLSQALTFDQSESRFNLNLPLHLSDDKITGLDDPTEDSDAATKSYVDNQLSTEINNLKWKDPVDTFANLPTCNADTDGHARLVEDENWIYRCDESDTIWHKVANVATVDHSVLQNLDAEDSHPASAISFSVSGNISADDVQNALEELDGETLHLDPVSSQTVTYGGANVQTVLKMNASQSASPFKITDSADSTIFEIGTTGLITTASVNSASIVNGSIAGGDLASNIGITTTGNISANILTSTIATGTAPLTISSITKVSNLNADLLDGFSTSQIGGASVLPAMDANGNLILQNAKIETETIKFEAETTAPTEEEGKVYYDSNDKTFKLYNTQEDSYTELIPNLPVQPTDCPDGYIPVPGNPLYGTAGGFCVMKYEAKCADIATPTVGLTSPVSDSDSDDTNGTYQTYCNDGNTVCVGEIGGGADACTSANGKQVVSLPDGYPIARISQDTAETYCESLGDGYHLITNNEWMTIARNIEKQSSNWTGGAVGSGGLWRGHTDNNPAAALEANSDDAQGYEGTGNSDPSIEKRTFTLSNGQVIWDLSGNVWDWNDNEIEANQAPIDSDPISEYIEFTAIANYQMMSYANTRPSNPAWNSSQNMGRLYTDYDDGSALRAFLRGGLWHSASHAGLFSLALYNSPGYANYGLGFRCVR